MPRRGRNLLACDAPDVVKHLAVLCGRSEPRLTSGLVLVADPRPWTTPLRKALPGMSFEFLELPVLQPGASRDARLPVPDHAFDAVIALDVAALLPGPRRRLLQSEVTRVCRRVAVNAMPLGTELQIMICRGLAKLHRDACGAEQPELATLLASGLPTPAEAFGWLEPDSTVEFYYAGDLLTFQTISERMILSNRWKDWAERIAVRALDARADGNLGLETVPMRRHRRMYLLFARK